MILRNNNIFIMTSKNARSLYNAYQVNMSAVLCVVLSFAALLASGIAVICNLDRGIQITCKKELLPGQYPFTETVAFSYPYTVSNYIYSCPCTEQKCA